MKVSRPLTRQEHQWIDALVTNVEERTATDFALVVTPVSDRYALYPLVWAGLLALLIAAVAALARPALAARAVILIQLGVLVVLTLLLDWLPIRLALVPKAVKHAHARHLARREFAAHSAGGGSNPSSILLFVALGERYVEILADRETHARAPEGAWDRIVADFLATVKTGRVADGIVGAVQACGAALEAFGRPND